MPIKMASSGSALLDAFGLALAFFLLLRGLRSMLIFEKSFWKNKAVGAKRMAMIATATAIPMNKKV